MISWSFSKRNLFPNYFYLYKGPLKPTFIYTLEIPYIMYKQRTIKCTALVREVLKKLLLH